MRARSIVEFNYNAKDCILSIKTKFINYEFKKISINLMCEENAGFSSFTGNDEVCFHINFKSKIMIIKNIGTVMDILNMDNKTYEFFSSV